MVHFDDYGTVGSGLSQEILCVRFLLICGFCSLEHTSFVVGCMMAFCMVPISAGHIVYWLHHSMMCLVASHLIVVYQGQCGAIIVSYAVSEDELDIRSLNYKYKR